MTTFKKWALAHDDHDVSIQQRDNDTGRVWAPGPRRLDATTRKTYLTFDGSRRDLAGSAVLESSVIDIQVRHTGGGFDQTAYYYCETCSTEEAK
jgi:hypothetical protein